MQQDFGALWPRVIRSQAEPSVQPENRRQGAGNEPEIVEVRMEKTAVDMRFDEPPVTGIGEATHNEKRVAAVAKATHIKEAQGLSSQPARRSHILARVV